MACDLTYGRKEACKDNVGGLLAIYVINFDDLPYANLEFDANEAISGITGGGTINAYKLLQIHSMKLTKALEIMEHHYLLER